MSTPSNAHTHLQCLFIYANPSQRVPAVVRLSVSFRFLKPMIFNTSAQWRTGQAPPWLEVCACCSFPRADWELPGPEEMHQFHPLFIFFLSGNGQSEAWERMREWQRRRKEIKKGESLCWLLDWRALVRLKLTDWNLFNQVSISFIVFISRSSSVSQKIKRAAGCLCAHKLLCLANRVSPILI